MPFVRKKATGIYIPKSEKLLDKVKEVLRYHHYSIRTERTYVNWITKYINYNSKKYPNASKSWVWQYVFPSKIISTDPRSGKKRRHHIFEDTVSKILYNTNKYEKIPKRVSPHVLRHSFAARMLE